MVGDKFKKTGTLHRGKPLILVVVIGIALIMTVNANAARFLTPLKIQTPLTELTSPQMAGTPIRWTVASTGGVPPFRYRYFIDSEFITGPKTGGKLASESRQPFWDWIASNAGRYRIRAQIEDDRGMLVESDWSAPIEIIPALRITAPTSELVPPVTSSIQIPLSVSADGGQAPYTYTFQLRLEGQDAIEMITTTEPNWIWQPAEAGEYQVRAVVTDSLGNQKPSEWSPTWLVNPIFQVLSIAPNRMPAVANRHSEVIWSTRIEGGVGDNQFQFSLYKEGELVQETESGASPDWSVTGWEDGSYQVQVKVSDNFGNQVEGWSSKYRVGIKTVAILPVYNLSGNTIPAGVLRSKLEEELRRLDFEPLSADLLDQFMVDNRWRHTAYLPETVAAELRQKFQVDAVFLTGVLTYQETDPPQLTVVSRMVGTGPDLPIIWADGVAGHGESAPGFLGLGRITDIGILKNNTLRNLIDKLSLWKQGDKVDPPDNNISIALFPFYSHTDQVRGGEILAAQLLINLFKQPGLRVLEPGLVRDRLLRFRVIAPFGPSESDMSLFKAKLDADLLITGSLTHIIHAPYDPVRIPPETSFSMKVIDLQTQKQVAQGSIFGKGDDRVYFYDFLRFWTTYDLTDHLLNKMISRWIRSYG
jgi:hypothetical protein